MEAHKILGVPKDASEKQIRAAYKALALKWHPDRQPQNREEATSKFMEINTAHRTMLRALARARRTANATRSRPSSDTQPPSPETLFASLKRPTRSTRPRRSPSSSPTSSRSPSSSPTHSSQPSRSSSRSRQDTPSTSTTSVNSAPISPTDTVTNQEGPAPQTDKSRRKKSDNQSSTCDLNPKTSLPSPEVAYEPDFVDDTLRPERSILRGAGADPPKKWVRVLNMTLEEIYQGKSFHFRLVRYDLSGKKSIVPLNVTVPLGSRDGTEVIVTNVGNERKDGTRQDIVFLVKALKHKRFSRIHDDLLLEVRLPWVDSLREKVGDVRVNGIDGKEYSFPLNFCKTGFLAGTAVIPNAGMPRNARNGKGKIIVRWEISSPPSSWDTLKHAFKFKR